MADVRAFIQRVVLDLCSKAPQPESPSRDSGSRQPVGGHSGSKSVDSSAAPANVSVADLQHTVESFMAVSARGHKAVVASTRQSLSEMDFTLQQIWEEMSRIKAQCVASHTNRDCSLISLQPNYRSVGAKRQRVEHAPSADPGMFFLLCPLLFL